MSDLARSVGWLVAMGVLAGNVVERPNLPYRSYRTYSVQKRPSRRGRGTETQQLAFRRHQAQIKLQFPATFRVSHDAPVTELGTQHCPFTTEGRNE